MQSDLSQTSQWTAVNVNKPLPKRQTEPTLETVMTLNCWIQSSSAALTKKKNMFFIFSYVKLVYVFFYKLETNRTFTTSSRIIETVYLSLSGLDFFSGRNKLFTFSLPDKTRLGVEFTTQCTTLVKLYWPVSPSYITQILTGWFLNLKRPCRKKTHYFMRHVIICLVSDLTAGPSCCPPPPAGSAPPWCAVFGYGRLRWRWRASRWTSGQTHTACHCESYFVYIKLL